MSLFRNIWDGAVSFGAALVTGAAIGGPVWATHRAIGAGLISQWYYIPTLVLLLVGVLMALAFLRKAVGGIAPLRDRRR